MSFALLLYSGAFRVALLHFLHVCGGPGLSRCSQPHPAQDILCALHGYGNNQEIII